MTVKAKYISPKDSTTVAAIRNLIELGEGKPEIGFSTNVGSADIPVYRSGSGWVKNYFTTNSIGEVVRSPVPAGGLTTDQNNLALDAAGSFYRQMMYDRFPEFAKSMPIGAMAVYSDVAHHGKQEHNRSPQWDEDNRMVWAARNGNGDARRYLAERGYKGTDFTEVAARQLLDYYSDGGKNRIYDRMVHRFNVLRDKLPKNARPWDYFGPDYKGPRKEVEEGLKKSWEKINQDSKGGKASRAALSGGETSGGSVQSGNEVPEGTEQTAQNNGGPRIIINPSTFRNEKDALCVAMNESFRIIAEVNGFNPVSEPTERQRKFFSDTAYNDDELMLRRTILARICTFDTSVKDPTDEQLQEAVEFLDTVMEIGAPQNEWEQRAVKRIRDTIAQSVGQPRAEEPSDEEPPEDAGAVTGAVGGGESEDDLEDLFDEPPNLDDGSLDDLFDTRSNTEKEATQVVDEIGKEGSAVVEGVEQLDPEGTKKALEYGKQMSEAVNNGFDASTQLPNSDPPQITSTSPNGDQSATSQPTLPMKNGHYVDDQGRVITKRAAEALAANRDAVGSQPTSAGTSPTRTGIGGRQLTAGEAAWQERREASQEASRSRRRLTQIGPNMFSSRHGRDLVAFI